MYASMPDIITSVTQRWISNTKTVIIPGKISIIPPQVPQTGIGRTQEAPLLWRILKRDWRNRTRYRYEVVIGGAQRTM
ncbi:hypothetical protein E2C01_035621 [Portunus trituberculatus]|uniref:Uncharacterized protein n=1 Tax=Portunus trituberculatus TaxID=210409 RepID=A0A5B7F9U7_PORTR|nr:hypothetical protein [Portunus trituberculatus]